MEIRKPQLLSKKHLAAVPLAVVAHPGREPQLDLSEHQPLSGESCG
jgi:hypothetical protein